MSLTDTNIHLALPYNHDREYPEWLDERAEQVAEVYLPIHISIGPTARPWGGPESLPEYHAELGRLAVVLARHELSANVVLNMPFWSAGRDEVVPEIGRMIDLFGPTTQVTLADFTLARTLRGAYPDLHLGVSTAARVENIQSAAYWVDGVGAKSVVLSREINKRPIEIRAIRSLGVRIKLVLDDNCIPHCPAQLAHALLVVSDRARLTVDADCFMKPERTQRPWLVAQKDVVPATLPLFEGLIDIAKLDGRSDGLESIDHRRQLFLESTSWEHVKRIYTEPPEALQKIFECDLNCPPCGWCERHFDYPNKR